MELGINMKYPEDFLNKIINNNCLDIIDYLPDSILDAVVSDPPYGEGMEYEGDENINEADNLLSCYLKKIEPKLKRNSHIAIFWTMRNLDVCIDTLRSSGFTYRRTLTMYIPKGNARPYLGWLPRSQAIVIGQKYLPKKPIDFHYDMANYLNNALAYANISRGELAKRLNCDSRLIMKWTRIGDPAWCLPTPRFYKPLKEILKLDNQFDILLEREPGNCFNKRDDLEYKHDTYIIDDKNTEMLHPSQKPLSVIKHIINCVCPINGIVFDGFSGSGTTPMACKETGRNFIAAEISEEYYKKSLKRLKDYK